MGFCLEVLGLFVLRWLIEDDFVIWLIWLINLVFWLWILWLESCGVDLLGFCIFCVLLILVLVCFFFDLFCVFVLSNDCLIIVFIFFCVGFFGLCWVFLEGFWLSFGDLKKFCGLLSVGCMNDMLFMVVVRCSGWWLLFIVCGWISEVEELCGRKNDRIF